VCRRPPCTRPPPAQSFDAKKEVTAATFDSGENRVLIGTAGGSLKGWELDTQKRESPRVLW
jgi:hypothetical protein